MVLIIKKHPDPLMGRGYLNVRATGGAVASSPYRGRPWRGWMLLCFFLRAEESKNMARLCLAKRGYGGYPPARWNLARGVPTRGYGGEVRTI